jgi:hypothetical protein
LTFSADNFRSAVTDYNLSWRALDEALYKLCQRYPHHTDQGGVNAKLWMVGRTYATGIERKIPANGRQGGSMSQLAEHLLKNSRQVDDIFDRLRRLAEPLDTKKLHTILALHGRFIALIQPVVRSNQSPRSFTSKYMHFHNPAVPIIDTYADAACRKMIRWQKSFCLFDLPPCVDKYYAWYVLRFWQLYQQAFTAGVKPTVKHLDYYLLSAGEAMA